MKQEGIKAYKAAYYQKNKRRPNKEKQLCGHILWRDMGHHSCNPYASKIMEVREFITCSRCGRESYPDQSLYNKCEYCLIFEQGPTDSEFAIKLRRLRVLEDRRLAIWGS